MKVVKEILEDLEDKIQFLDDRIVELLLRNISNEERKRMSENNEERRDCLLYTSPSPRDA